MVGGRHPGASLGFECGVGGVTRPWRAVVAFLQCFLVWLWPLVGRRAVVGSGACLVPALGQLMGCAWPGAVGRPGPVTRLVCVSLTQTDGLSLLALGE
ncbi:hypothetical protein ILYODFUR_015637 [Ilyodon furcidens]|uniref:Uncharacterized protein n=1 Tax=Ilyodon furcidens TaxID=33524 RepID=A0ABV0UHC8_9TELE